MKPIAPSVPLTQPSLVPPSAEQSHTSQPIPPRPPPLPRCKTGEVFTAGLEFDSRVGVSRLQAYPRLARASSALGRQLFKNPVPFRPYQLLPFFALYADEPRCAHAQSVAEKIGLG